jgi:hypothetical protein
VAAAKWVAAHSAGAPLKLSIISSKQTSCMCMQDAPNSPVRSSVCTV